jgi:predicted alpha/beta hydrolase family esterase
MNNVNCIIIHGCPFDPKSAMNFEIRVCDEETYDKHWISWIRNELISRGIKTEVPLMPKPWQPVYEDFKKEFEKFEVTEKTILIGHSCGCSFLTRWLGETKKKIFKLIFVAPWKINNRRDEFREKFYTYQIDESIKERVEKIIMFTADDEKKEGKNSLNIYHQTLGGTIINLKKHGHYTMNDMGTQEFPELLKVILEE